MEVKMPWFVEELKENDPEYYPVVADLIQKALTPRVLDEKTKQLIILALDACIGASEGVKVVAAQAREAGSCEEEIREALRLAYFVRGMDTLKSAVWAF